MVVGVHNSSNYKSCFSPKNPPPRKKTKKTQPILFPTWFLLFLCQHKFFTCGFDPKFESPPCDLTRVVCLAGQLSNLSIPFVVFFFIFLKFFYWHRRGGFPKKSQTPNLAATTGIILKKKKLVQNIFSSELLGAVQFWQLH